MHLLLWTYVMLYFICIAFSCCEEREGSEKYKMKLIVSRGIRTNARHDLPKLIQRPRPLGQPTEMFKCAQDFYSIIHMNKINNCVTKYVSN